MLDESLTDKSPTDKSPMDKSPKEKTPKLTKANLTWVFGAFIGAPNGSDQNELIKWKNCPAETDQSSDDHDSENYQSEEGSWLQ